MPGFDPIGSTPVASIGSAAPVVPEIRVSEQSAAIAITNMPGVLISEQSVAIAILGSPVPPPPPQPRRRQYVLM